ncbi:MAG: hypothetical protein Q9160_007502 [Pyrenula sp. 1 TL-2023]
MASESNKMNGTTQLKEQSENIWVVAGPAGCGKSTVAQHIAKELSLPYIEGDDVRIHPTSCCSANPLLVKFHSKSNKDKMASNVPLTDADRWDWLVTLREETMKALAQTSGVVVTCSALKRKYRDEFRVVIYSHRNAKLHFLFLQAPEAILQQRVAARQGHYMKSSMVSSQFANLEEAQADETDMHSVDVGVSEKEVQKQVSRLLKTLLPN